MGRFSLAAFLVVAISAVAGGGRPLAEAVGPTTVEVTSSGDGTGALAACPDATKCTLRKAIEYVNLDATANAFVITFSSALFKPAAPAVIIVGAVALPPVTHADVTLDGAGGVIIDGAATPPGSPGLQLEGPNAVVRGLQLRHVSGSCLLLSGLNATVGGVGSGQGNRLSACGIGISVLGADSVVRGNVVGFAAGGPAGATGIQASASNIQVGSADNGGGANFVGDVSIGIRVGDPVGPPVTGVIIGRNVIGKDTEGAPAKVDIGVQLRHKSGRTRVVRNSISTYALAAVQLVPDSAGSSLQGNTIEANIFGGESGRAIDLNADNVRNPNDATDADTGPNGLLNHPIFVRATQARLTGSACPGCRIELYLARHRAGALTDEGAIPLPFPALIADASGSFALDAPPLSPGAWISALATDPDGNTSEFGPSARVGAGAIQCGNPLLARGWNHTGYFGTEPLTLGTTLPGDPGHRIRAVYHLVDGTNQYLSWLRDAPLGSSLTSLEPGEAYWFLVDDEVALPGGFALNQPLNVGVKAGWNDIVYFGATGDVRDALSNIEGAYAEVHRWFSETPSATGRWRSWGERETPGWARGFGEMEACGVYTIRATADGTIVPLQP